MTMNPTRDDFSALLDEAFGSTDFAEGTVVKGKIVGIEKDFAIVDVGIWHRPRRQGDRRHWRYG
jgi:small subunit ribosomal protein S1